MLEPGAEAFGQLWGHWFDRVLDEAGDGVHLALGFRKSHVGLLGGYFNLAIALEPIQIFPEKPWLYSGFLRCRNYSHLVYLVQRKDIIDGIK